MPKKRSNLAQRINRVGKKMIEQEKRSAEALKHAQVAVEHSQAARQRMIDRMSKIGKRS